MPDPADAGPADAGPAGAAIAHVAVARLVREEGTRVLATLVRTTGSWALAEDAVQDAVVRALQAWPRDGIPPEPRAWLTVTARRRAIDLIRREAARAGKETAALAELEPADAPPPEHGVLRDDLLRLLFTCCHPALPVEAQTALALRTLCGFSPAEVANALLVTEAAMTKRLTRARRKIAVAGIPYRTPPPAELPGRLQGVLTTVYLLFNEGYHATGGEGPLRSQLTEEAIRLAALLRELLPDQVAVVGLLSLLHLHNARGPARLDEAGELVRLPEQDRSRWDHAEIRHGLELLGVALRHSTGSPDPYVVQAAIAACHDLASTWEQTNWTAIVSWYDVLLRVGDTPVVRLNRAVAIGELRGAAAGLRELDSVQGLGSYLPYVAARAELLARAGRRREASDAYRAALRLPMNAATQRTLRVLLAESS
ncbi:MAG: sigma-70 family RNA polymerase sigma factor [Microbacteriaceae bacterium]|nr:MAG: sigma-70 family RNA polymerase sigma factor [Microbacteriaceae bacterium]